MSWSQPSLAEPVLPEINFDCAEGRPIPLIRVQNRRFELVAETEALVAQIPGHVAFCAVMGKLRTGKSFLLNKVIGARTTEGFAVSDSVNACTKGLWLWSKPVFNEQRDLSIFFMDTEGLDSVDRDADIDARLFALATLLSSFFIYNTVGSIDQPAINGLALVARLAQTVIASEGDAALNEYALASYAPRLLWVLRDFTLEPRDANGVKTSPQLYLESALSVIQGSDAGRSASTEHRVRGAVLGFFRRRDCLGLVRPVFNENEVRVLPRLDDSQLRPEFLAQVNAIRNKVWQNCSAKVIGGAPLNGERILGFALQLISAFNAGRVPMLGSAWQSLLEAESRSAMQSALALHRKILQSASQPSTELCHKRLQAHGAALSSFYRGLSVSEQFIEPYVAQLTAELDVQENSVLSTLHQANSTRDEEAVARLYSALLRNPSLLGEAGQRFGDLINEEVYQPLLRQSESDVTNAIVRATAKLSPTLFSALASALDAETEARKRATKSEAEKERQRRAADDATLKRSEAQVQLTQAQIKKLEQQIGQIKSADRTDEEELLEKKERLEAKRREIREQIACLGNTLAENRMKIENQQNKKKRTLCG